MQGRDLGLVLRRTPFQETSLVVQVLTRQAGRLSLLARGVRNSRKENRAALAGYHTLELFWRQRQAGGLALLTGVELQKPRHRLASARMGPLAAQLLQEAPCRCLGEGDPHPELFDLLGEGLDLLEAGAPPGPLAAAALVRMLGAFGWGWRLDQCAGCGGREGLCYFSRKRGQTVCQGCGAPYRQQLFPLAEPTREVLMRLEWPPPFALLSPRAWQGVLRMACATLAWHSGRALLAEPLLLAGWQDADSSPLDP